MVEIVGISSKQAEAAIAGEKKKLEELKAVPKLIAVSKEITHPPEHVLENLAHHAKINSEHTSKNCKEAELNCRIAGNRDKYFVNLDLHRKVKEMLFSVLV